MSKVKKIMVVSNTHWDREFRFSFEKTRFNLIRMLDMTLDILERDPDYHSFTMDGHTIMIDDYLEMRPEKLTLVKKLITERRLIIGPYYTLAEQFSISHEAIVRNLIIGRKKLDEYGAKHNTVAYTPSSWGQTGQYPQILKDFDIDKMMFYRGISHDEASAEYIWEAPDGTQMLASRFALYCRYNWYYQVHRSVTRHKVWEKDYNWGEYNDVPFCKADTVVDGSQNYNLVDPEKRFDGTALKKAIEDMLNEEEGHFTTPIFLAMNGHDISAAYPLESKIISDAKKLFDGEIEIEHTNLEHFWDEAQKYLDKSKMTILKGERRSYLKKGKWTYLFPSTISARTYLKQQDFMASNKLTYYAEPCATLTQVLFGEYSEKYLNRGWQYLLSNHTHDANGGCAPDSVCLDMEYRYRKVSDIGDIVTNEALAKIAQNLSPNGLDKSAVLLLVYNPLPFKRRNVVTRLTLDMPLSRWDGINASEADFQIIKSEKSSILVDSIWDVPTILDSTYIEAYACITDVPACGYKVIPLVGKKNVQSSKMIAHGNILENEFLKIGINDNGTIDVKNKKTGKEYKGLNYFTSSGEIGNAWQHISPQNDKVFTTENERADITDFENGVLCASMSARLTLKAPKDCIQKQSTELVDTPIEVIYTLKKDADYVEIEVKLNNTACDHLLRANFKTAIETECSYSDSHFDVVKRAIKVPDSTGWVEPAYGVQPLRTFATVTNNKDGFAIMPKGLYEYEVFEDTTMALTLLRGCRIKQAVSEEKQIILDDMGALCLGEQNFKYALHFYNGDICALTNKAAEYFVPVTCVMSGIGKGNLPLEQSIIEISNKNVHITAIKKAEDNDDIIIRLFNSTDIKQKVMITFGFKTDKIFLAKMSEEIVNESSNEIYVDVKKIVTVRVRKEDND